MTSRKIFYKYFLNGNRRYLWSFLLSLFLFSLTTILILSTATQQYNDDIYLLDIEHRIQVDFRDIITMIFNPGSKIVMVILSSILGVFSFSFLHNKSKTDMYHSLPISRGKIFASEYVFSLLSLILGYIIPVFVSMLMIPNNLEYINVDYGIMFVFILQSIIICCVIYSITTIATILCGTTILSVIFTIIFLYVPTILLILIENIKSVFLVTYPTPNMEGILHSSPVIEYFAYFLNLETVDVKYMIIYSVIFVVLTLIAYFLYKLRKSETCGNSVNFPKIKSPIEVIVGITMSIGLGTILYLINQDVIFSYVIGAIIGAMITHIVAQVAYEFSFRSIFKKLYNLGIAVCVALVICLGARYDILGYDSQKVDNVESYRLFASSEFIDNPEYISENTELFEEFVDVCSKYVVRNNFSLYKGYGITVEANYGGLSTFKRVYKIPGDERSNELYDTLLYSKEYVEKNHVLFNLDDLTIREIEYDTNYERGSIAKDEVISTNNPIIEALKKDLLQEKMLDENARAIGYIELICETKDGRITRVNMDLYDTYTNTLEIFIEKGIDFDDKLIAEKIKEITIINYGNEELGYELEKNAIKFSEQEDIKKIINIIENNGYSTYEKSKIGAEIRFTNEYYIEYWLKANEEVLDLFK